MSDPAMDGLPSHERERVRKRLRNPWEYAKLREKVKGPEDLQRELRAAEALADAKLALESDEQAQEGLRRSMHEQVQAQGPESLVDVAKLTPQQRSTLEQGRFTVAVREDAKGTSDALSVVPEGNVSDRLPLKPAASLRYTQQLLGATSDEGQV
jgi:hypothetical protein